MHNNKFQRKKKRGHYHLMNIKKLKIFVRILFNEDSDGEIYDPNEEINKARQFSNENNILSPNIKKTAVSPDSNPKEEISRDFSVDSKEILNNSCNESSFPEHDHQVFPDNKFTFRTVSKITTNGNSFKEKNEETSLIPATDTLSLNITALKK